MADEPKKSLLESIPPLPPEYLKFLNNSREAAKHFAAIGRVASAWSHLEALIDTFSIELAEVDPKVGVCFVGQLIGHGRKLDAFIALARHQRKIPAGINKELEELSKKLQSLSERRNRNVHDVWHFDYPNPPRRLEATARKTVRLEFIPVPTNDLLKLEIEISNKTDYFTDLSERILALPHTSPKTLSGG